jgi:hypothetical protein
VRVRPGGMDILTNPDEPGKNLGDSPGPIPLAVRDVQTSLCPGPGGVGCSGGERGNGEPCTALFSNFR